MSVQRALPPMAVHSLDGDRRRDPSPVCDGQLPSIAMTAVVKDALLRHYGSLKAAALSLQMDQGQLTRELQSGDFKFAKLERDPAAKAVIAQALYEAFGQDTPRLRVLRLIREARRVFDELAEVMA